MKVAARVIELRFIGPHATNPWAQLLVRTAVVTLCLFASLAFQREQATAAERFSMVISQVDSSNFPTTVAYLTVTDDKSYPILGLNTSNFQIMEDGDTAKNVEVTSAVDSQEPLAAVITIDTSGSMDGAAMDAEKKAAITFIESLREQDHAKIIAFSTGVNTVVDFTTDKGALINGINSLAPSGNTALYDALFTSVEETELASPKRRIVVLMTDGQNTKSLAKLDDGLNLATQKGVAVYTIGLGSDIQQTVLHNISQQTRASSMVAPSPSDLEGAYKTIADRLRQQYVVKYTSPNPKGAKTYHLAVTVSSEGDRTAAEAKYDARPTPPSIKALSLRDGETLDSATPVTIDASSGLPISKVTMKINGQLVKEVVAPPYSLPIDTSQLSAGKQDVVITVVDIAGGETSKKITVVVPPSAITSSDGSRRGIDSTGEDQAPSRESSGLSLPQISFVGTIAERITKVTGLVHWEPRQVGMMALVLAASAAGTLETWKTISLILNSLSWQICSICYGKYRSYRLSCPDCRREEHRVDDKERTLGEFLIQNNLVTQDDLIEAMSISQQTGKALEIALVESGKASAKDISKANFYLSHSVEIQARIKDVKGTKDTDEGQTEWLIKPTVLARNLSIVVLSFMVIGLVAPNLF